MQPAICNLSDLFFSITCVNRYLCLHSINVFKSRLRKLKLKRMTKRHNWRLNRKQKKNKKPNFWQKEKERKMQRRHWQKRRKWNSQDRVSQDSQDSQDNQDNQDSQDRVSQEWSRKTETRETEERPRAIEKRGGGKTAPFRRGVKMGRRGSFAREVGRKKGIF